MFNIVMFDQCISNFSSVYKVSDVNIMSASSKKYDEKNYKLTAGYCRIESGDMNIIDGIISIIFEYQKLATWSNIHKGGMIKLSEDDTKATCVDDDYQSVGHSVRADFCIARGQMVSWELEFKTTNDPCNFFGVVSSKVKDFSICPYRGMKGAYGLDDENDMIYKGYNREKSSWDKPEFPTHQTVTLKVIADWTEKQCKLTFFYNEKKMGEMNEDYTMLLPELEDDDVWYPCVTPYNNKAYCIIRYNYV